MAIIKLIPIYEYPASNEGIQNQIRFLVNPVDNPSHRCGGCNFTGRNTDEIAYQFSAVYDYYGYKYPIPATHIVLSFILSDEQFVRPRQAEQIADRFCKEMFRDSHQVVWGVHETEYTRDVHFMVNTVSFRNGRLLLRNYALLKNILDSMNKILADNQLWHGIHPIHKVDLIFD